MVHDYTIIERKRKGAWPRRRSVRPHNSLLTPLVLRSAATKQWRTTSVSLDGVEVLELDCKDDGSYHVSSLSALIGCDGAGLRYKNECTGNFQGVKVTTDGELLQPRGGWGSRIL